MLRSRADFARLAAHGRTRTHRLLVIHFVSNALDHDRFGISTGRRLGGAVVRNRVRRRIREVLRAAPSAGGVGRDILIVVRPSSSSASFAELRTALEDLLAAARGSVTASS
jgi:ribonuclease P protein component